jgi:nitric oxide reductase NorD protein
MALDEYLFGKISAYLRKGKRVSGDLIARTVKLEDIKPRFIILASALSGEKIEIFPADREGGYKNNNFFLPSSFSLFPSQEDNYSFYLFRVFYLSVQRHLSLNWHECAEQPVILSQKKAEDTAPHVLYELFRLYPSLRELHRDLVNYIVSASGQNKVDYTWLYGKWMRNENTQTPDSKLNNISDSIKKASLPSPTTILKAMAVEDVTSISVDTKQQEDYVLTHNFEKVETADDFNGVWRDFDGDDELESHSDALSELSMKFTVRVDDPVHSVYEAEFVENATISESMEASSERACFLYSEWDYGKRVYKENFCKVYPVKQAQKDGGYYRSIISGNKTLLNRLRKNLANINNKQQQQRRQTQGEEFDIDSVTDMFADIVSRRTPTDKIYLSNRKKGKDLSVLLLLDISLSSDGYVDGNRVIDVEKQVSILFGEILNEYNIDFAIKGFYSKTRNFSTYLSIKDFDEQWEIAKYRIGAVEPQGYTRIGPALRHSGALLNARKSRNKWVLLISDGKPNDYDRYEGRYGINDVRQALRELNEFSINSYALAIEANAKYYLPQMFGQNHYQVLSKTTDLIHSMVALYNKMKHMD